MRFKRFILWCLRVIAVAESHVNFHFFSSNLIELVISLSTYLYDEESMKYAIKARAYRTYTSS